MPNKNDNLEKKVSPPSFIKLAMRNMVRKGSKSISHFSITFLILMGLLILIATLGKPHMPV
ncbi:conserved hypothetical protein [Prochlorococcus marinus str. MIT 9515]|uniref:DUF3285 domain-containing protein n=1 Tax=Prochlorococcus marinus (strain MIT 9515) TaxID=167542 RepID=A2BUF8_PROM5|nr:DUF3285 domain-containing protein [Prochlorococcus marinus]ABM71419.1 conserved hypothetical protein [Prochlorococcus marinus str. MIT 9515]